MATKKDKKVNKINKDTNLAQLVSDFPDTQEVLLDWGLHCVGCALNTLDSIEMGAKLHGYSDEEIAELVDRLNEIIEFGE